MSTRDLIEATKHGPALAFAVLIATLGLGLLNLFGILSALQTSLLLLPTAAILWACLKSSIESATWLNRKWLEVVQNIHPKVSVRAINYRREPESHEIHCELSLSNSGFKEIQHYRMLLWVPRQLLPGSYNHGAADESRSTGTELCLKIPTKNEKTQEPLTDGRSRVFSAPLVLRDKTITPTDFSSQIRSEVWIEGLLVYRDSQSVGSFFELENFNGIRIKGVKAA